jgi:hypothetical protein
MENELTPILAGWGLLKSLPLERHSVLRGSLEDQHRVAVAVKAVLFANRFLIRLSN